MKSYLNIIQNIIDNGEWKENRTGVKCLTLPFIHWKHDMSDGYPLCTTRRMPFKSMLVELEGFIKGITDKKWYEEHGTKFWSFWCSPQALQRRIYGDDNFDHNLPKGIDNNGLSKNKILELQKEERDLGPLGYSHGLRRFGQKYHPEHQGILEGIDQLKNIVNELKKDPNSRRLLWITWNPLDLKWVALPSCHVLVNLVHINGKLHLHWHQRSCDVACGISQNIPSYATLLLLLCKETNLKPGILSAMFADCHIYENHIDGLKIILERKPYPLPKLNLINNKSIFEWSHKDVELINYKYHPKLKFQVTI